eukprot:SAG11_NODE_2575_length_3206_cov_1.588993_3_plen_243_part_00
MAEDDQPDLPGAPMESSTSSAKYKPVEPLTLQGLPDTTPSISETDGPPAPIKPKRKRRTSVQMAKEAIVDTGKAIGGKLRSAGKAVGGAMAKPKKKGKGYDDTARDLHSRRDIQLAMKGAYGVVVAMAALSFALIIIELEVLTKGYLEKGSYTQTMATQTLKGIVSFASLVSALFMTRYYQHWFAYLAVTQGRFVPPVPDCVLPSPISELLALTAGCWQLLLLLLTMQAIAAFTILSHLLSG